MPQPAHHRSCRSPPATHQAINYVPAGAQIPLGDMLPNEDLRDYVTYEGSLTTPPCSEGLLWHVLTKPQRISVNQWRKYLSAVGMKVGDNCKCVANALLWQWSCGRHMVTGEPHGLCERVAACRCSPCGQLTLVPKPGAAHIRLAHRRGLAVH